MVDAGYLRQVRLGSKTGNQSAIYASGLTGKAVITGCTFDNIDWDAIQITPKTTTAEIVITDNVFTHTNTTGTQLRYVHIEHDAAMSSGSKIAGLTVTDNQFYNTQNTNDIINSIGIWFVKDTTTTLQLSGNYVEDIATVAVGYGMKTIELYPMRSKPNVDIDDIAPVAYDEDENVYFELQNAIDQTEQYVYLMADAADQTATIPAGKTINFYPYGHNIGTLTNYGELTVYDAEVPKTSTIINYGVLDLYKDSATAYEVENNGTLLITGGATYDLNKITKQCGRHSVHNRRHLFDKAHCRLACALVQGHGAEWRNVQSVQDEFERGSGKRVRSQRAEVLAAATTQA